MEEVRRIVVTGGPGAGKTTVWRALAEQHPSLVIPVPEVATSLLSHVFPGVQSEPERIAVQRSIFTVQHSLETIHASRAQPGQTLLCDRGTPDGGGYWPEGHLAFFSAMQTRWQRELERYTAVLFLQTAAAQGLPIGTENPVRSEDPATAIAIDQKLFAIWSRHPRFVHVVCERSFAQKVKRGSEALSALLTLPR